MRRDQFIPEKEAFFAALKEFAASLSSHITNNDEWTIKGFIDIFNNIYSMSSDTKIISKTLELHLFPHFVTFADTQGYSIELASCQNWYPDITFISKTNPQIKFAVDLKTTYRDEEHPGFCNGFTLGSHGEYFTNRSSTKNIQYPYNVYLGHYCLGIIYSRIPQSTLAETKKYTLNELCEIPSVINHFIFFAQEKWRIASDRSGSGNTANIGSIQNITDILSGNGVFALAGEDIFDDYWANYGQLTTEGKDGNRRKISSLLDYLKYRGLDPSLYNPKAPKRKVSNEH